MWLFIFEPITIQPDPIASNRDFGFPSNKEVEIKYAEAEKKLDSKKKKQVEKIIKENHDDPDAITEKLASLTGFEIYVE